MSDDMNDLRQRIEQLALQLATEKARVTKMREALKELEWATWSGILLQYTCPHCGAAEAGADHHDGCILRAALEVSE